MNEHVPSPVGVPRYEVGGTRDERHEAAVGAERGPVAFAVPLVPGAVHADALGGAGLPVVDEHVVVPVGVPGHEIGGERGEGDEAAVGAEHRPGEATGVATLTVPLVPGAVHAHALGGARLPVVDEDVSGPVGV